MTVQSMLITGTSTGFGRLTAEAAAREGYRVFAAMRGVNGKNREAAASLQTEAERQGWTLTVLELDVTRPEDIAAAVQTVEAEAGGLDILVNNAGIFGMGPTEAYTEDQVRLMLETNVVGVHAVTRGFLPMMRRQKSGLIINISSGVGRLVMPGAAVYCASKFALEALTEAYRYDLSEHGIDVVSVEPGAYGTEIFGKTFDPADAERAGAYPSLGQVLAGVGEALGAAVQADDASNPREVAETVLRLAAAEPGQRPLRVPVGKDILDVVSRLNAAGVNAQQEFMNAFGFGKLAALAE